MSHQKILWVRLFIGLMVLFCLGVVFSFQHIASKNAIKIARAEYDELEINPRKENIERNFRLNYQSLRTIGLLPGIRNLSNTARGKIDSTTVGAAQQLYNNLAAEIPISEIYVITIPFDPTRDRPVLELDHMIMAQAATDQVHYSSDTPEEYEGDEYRAYDRVLQKMEGLSMAVHHSNLDSIPAQSTDQIRTCDNAQYRSKKHGDIRETYGFGYAVPFFDSKGELRGVVSSILRVNALETLLRGIATNNVAELDRGTPSQLTRPNKPKSVPFLLAHSKRNIKISDRNFQGASRLDSVLRSFLAGQIPDLNRYSVQKVKIKDQGDWFLVAEYPSDLAQGRLLFLRLVFGSVALLVIIGGSVFARWYGQNRRHQQQIEKANARLLSFFEKMPVSVIVTDAAEKITYVNHAFELHTGYLSNEILGQKPKILSSGQSDPHAFADIKRNIYAGQNWKGVLCNRKKDGTLYWVQSTISPYYEGGQITHFIGVHEDINELHAKEIELEQARIEADRANSAKSEFLSVMSHEIRTPLNAVLGFSQLLAIEPHLPEQAESIHTLERSAQHLLGLINDILDYSKIEAGKIELSPENFELGEMLGDIQKMFANAAAEKGIELRLECDADKSPWVFGDRLRIGQVLANLVSNAIKFTHKGKVQLYANIHRLENDQCFIAFAVKDTGIGMSSEQKQRLFQPFAQADSGIARNYGGTGLGLLISQRILQMHGSEIHIESSLGHGSCFTFELMLKKGTVLGSTVQATAYADGHQSLVGKTILLVDDNSINLRVGKRFLEIWGVRVITANSGRTALDLIQKESVDLVLMDLQMPEMDGFETARQIDAIKPQIPVLALSAETEAEIEDEIRHSKMVGWVPKPFRSEQLFQAISKLLVS